MPTLLASNKLEGKWVEDGKSMRAIFLLSCSAPFIAVGEENGTCYIHASTYMNSVCWSVFIGSGTYQDMYQGSGTQPCIYRAKLIAEQKVKDYAERNKYVITWTDL